jgi:hypothetical protein
MNLTTIIPNPSWGKTLELLQANGTIRISSSDKKTFQKLLKSIKLEHTTEDNTETKLTRFTLNKTI